MIVGAMAMTKERAKVLELTESFHSSSVQLLLVRPTGEAGPGAGLLLAPFTPLAWFLVSLAFVLVSIGLFLIGRYSPHEWSRVPPEKDVRRSQHSFGLKNSFLFAVSALTWQGYRELPKSLSGRVVAVAWWFFVVLILLAYVSNLTALVSLRPHLRPALPFRTYQDILRDKSVDVGMIRNGDAHQELRSSDDALDKQLFEFVNSRKQWFTSISDALHSMRHSSGHKQALLLPTYKARHLTSYQCDLITHGHGVGMIHYVFGLPSGNHVEAMKRRINTAILVLRETGELEQLSRKWENRGSYCPDPEGSALPVTLEGAGNSLPFMALGPRDLIVAFVLLLLCGLVAAGLLVMEILCVKKREKGEGHKKVKTEAEVKPLFTKRKQQEPDVVLTMEAEEHPKQQDKAKEQEQDQSFPVTMNTHSVDKSSEDTNMTPKHEHIYSEPDDQKDSSEKETCLSSHDVTIHQAA